MLRDFLKHSAGTPLKKTAPPGVEEFHVGGAVPESNCPPLCSDDPLYNGEADLARAFPLFRHRRLVPPCYLYRRSVQVDPRQLLQKLGESLLGLAGEPDDCLLIN